jgi:hypothetical protein
MGTTCALKHLSHIRSQLPTEQPNDTVSQPRPNA